MNKLKVYIGLIGAQLCFATLPIALKLVFRDLSSPAVAMLRVMGAALVFLALQKILVRERVRGAHDHLSLAVFAVFGVVLNQVLYITAVEHTTATAAQMMMAAGPALTLLVAILARQETASPAKWLGIGLAGSGALALVGVGVGTGDAYGNMLALANIASYSVYLVISRRLLERYQPLTVVTWVFLYGMIGMLPWGFMYAAEEASGAPPVVWQLMAFIVVVPTVGAYYLNMLSLKHLDSSVVGVFIYLQPVVSGILAHWLLRERVSVWMLPAALLILAGVCVTAWAARRESRAAAFRSPADAG